MSEISSPLYFLPAIQHNTNHIHNEYVRMQTISEIPANIQEQENFDVNILEQVNSSNADLV